ncbi:hypothetical protein HanPSC8_Chr09g0374311 [Helianthus annuus]|nr:hypothetical protein HanPSC8_Chr09g0374311 [Helianthus annuus]
MCKVKWREKTFDKVKHIGQSKDKGFVLFITLLMQSQKESHKGRQ